MSTKTVQTKAASAVGQISQLVMALAKAQSQFEEITKNATGYSALGEPFRYADSAEITAKTRPALTANGLTLVQPIVQESTGAVLLTILMHEGGETLESRIKLSDQITAQDFGAQISLMRRYAKCALLDLAAEDDADALGLRGHSAKQGLPDRAEESEVDFSIFYDEELFTSNLPEWTRLISTGEMTAEDVIAMVESKVPLSESQIERIKAADSPY